MTIKGCDAIILCESFYALCAIKFLFIMMKREAPVLPQDWSTVTRQDALDLAINFKKYITWLRFEKSLGTLGDTNLICRARRGYARLLTKLRDGSIK